jgi:hypothetical protein
MIRPIDTSKQTGLFPPGTLTLKPVVEASNTAATPSATATAIATATKNTNENTSNEKIIPLVEFSRIIDCSKSGNWTPLHKKKKI